MTLSSDEMPTPEPSDYPEGEITVKQEDIQPPSSSSVGMVSTPTADYAPIPNDSAAHPQTGRPLLHIPKKAHTNGRIHHPSHTPHFSSSSSAISIPSSAIRLKNETDQLSHQHQQCNQQTNTTTQAHAYSSHTNHTHSYEDDGQPGPMKWESSSMGLPCSLLDQLTDACYTTLLNPATYMFDRRIIQQAASMIQYDPNQAASSSSVTGSVMYPTSLVGSASREQYLDFRQPSTTTPKPPRKKKSRPLVDAECEVCRMKHDGSYGGGRFCSSGCSRQYSVDQRWIKQRALYMLPVPQQTAPF